MRLHRFLHISMPIYNMLCTFSHCFTQIRLLLLCFLSHSFLAIKVLTSFGFSCVTLSPCPSLPYSPSPQVYSSPLDVMAALWELPQAMSRMRFDFKVSIIRGLSRLSRLLCPNLPSSPSPQEKTWNEREIYYYTSAKSPLKFNRESFLW